MAVSPSADRQPAGPTGRPRVLIVRVGAMGDVLHALPAVALLRQWLPSAEIGWAIEPRWSALLQADESAAPGTPAMPLVDRLHLVEARQWTRQPFAAGTRQSILDLRRSLRWQHYDLAIDLQGSLRSALIARFSGARQVIGSDSPRETPARWFYHRTQAHRRTHVVEHAAELVHVAISGSLDADPGLPFPLPAPPLPHDPAAELWCDDLLAGSSAPAIVLAPTAGWGAKQWPAERFGHLARELAARGYRVFLNSSPPLPDTTAERILANVGPGPASEPVGRAASVQIVSATLAQLIALLRRAALVVAGDTGPLHLAAALQRPVVALFGPTDPARNGPFQTPNHVLRHSSSVTNHRRHPDTEAGLNRIGVDEVLNAALDLLPH